MSGPCYATVSVIRSALHPGCKHTFRDLVNQDLHRSRMKEPSTYPSLPERHQPLSLWGLQFTWSNGDLIRFLGRNLKHLGFFLSIGEASLGTWTLCDGHVSCYVTHPLRHRPILGSFAVFFLRSGKVIYFRLSQLYSTLLP